MLDEAAVKKLRERYKIHPWIFNRSCAYAYSLVELFDILEGLPKTYPIIWDNDKRQWVKAYICKQNLKE